MKYTTVQIEEAIANAAQQIFAEAGKRLTVEEYNENAVIVMGTLTVVARCLRLPYSTIDQLAMSTQAIIAQSTIDASGKKETPN